MQAKPSIENAWSRTDALARAGWSLELRYKAEERRAHYVHVRQLHVVHN